jgi:hypothetical protein
MRTIIPPTFIHDLAITVQNQQATNENFRLAGQARLDAEASKAWRSESMRLVREHLESLPNKLEALSHELSESSINKPYDATTVPPFLTPRNQGVPDATRLNAIPERKHHLLFRCQLAVPNQITPASTLEIRRENVLNALGWMQYHLSLAFDPICFTNFFANPPADVPQEELKVIAAKAKARMEMLDTGDYKSFVEVIRESATYTGDNVLPDYNSIPMVLCGPSFMVKYRHDYINNKPIKRTDNADVILRYNLLQQQFFKIPESVLYQNLSSAERHSYNNSLFDAELFGMKSRNKISRIKEFASAAAARIYR